jgi:hypothetical protein
VTQQADAASQKSQQAADNESQRRLLTKWRAAVLVRLESADAAVAQHVEFLRRIRGSETRG